MLPKQKKSEYLTKKRKTTIKKGNVSPVITEKNTKTSTSDNNVKSDVSSHRKKSKLRKKKGLISTHVHLGRDTCARLAAIYKSQLGGDLNYLGKKDIDSLGDVISYCITKAYNDLDDNKQDSELVIITPATSYESHKLYAIYQYAKYLSTEKKLTFEKIRARLNYEGVSVPLCIAGRGHNIPNRQWHPKDIENLLDTEMINKYLKELNNYDM
ncbi:hypothetical protein [Proteus terrae]|uniref:hypothetical protein n=1 Tax=Proteus terrae TaxID=1574161 RepID=UPI00227560AB|nr:hypothetical protein [Providencia rettgeri]